MPVLVMSPQASDEMSMQVLKFGATDFLSKPFHVRELLARVRMQLRVRREILHARHALHSTEVELAQVRTEAEKRRQLVDILQEVHGDFSPEELYHILTRRVAHALDITHCSLILARPGDVVGIVAAAYETPGLRHLEIELETLSRDSLGARDLRAGARGGCGDEPVVLRSARGVEDRAQRREGALGDRAAVPH